MVVLGAKPQLISVWARRWMDSARRSDPAKIMDLLCD